LPRVSSGRARTILNHPLAGAFGTGCLQKAEARTLTDMTFLKFAAIYVSPVPLFLFYPPLASFFPQLALAPPTPAARFLGGSLLSSLSLSRPLVATPYTPYIVDSPRRLSRREGASLSLFLLPGESRYFYLLLSASSSAAARRLGARASFLKSKTGLSGLFDVRPNARELELLFDFTRLVPLCALRAILSRPAR